MAGPILFRYYKFNSIIRNEEPGVVYIKKPWTIHNY